jgi:DNA polymerase elongation subunit (family B)
MPKLKRLFFDIEVSPNIGFFWQPGHKISIGYENIIKERAIICICYKWDGEKKVSSLTWDGSQDDKQMLKSFIKVANSADELIGHNGDRFDLTWIRTRCLFHGIPVFPTFVTIDTLKAARQKFRFNSNRLDYIGKFLNLGQKLHTGFDLWKGIVLEKDEPKLKKMVRYCKQDVRLLEAVFNKLKNYIPAKTHAGVIAGKDKRSCPECGSDKVNKVVKRVSALGTIKQQMKCMDCGKYHSVNIKDDRQTKTITNKRG